MEATYQVGGFSARLQEDGSLIIFRVPIFVECERRDLKFDLDWITKAIAKAKQAEREGYLPPLHVRHHDEDTEVRAAGFFRILGTEARVFKGALRTAVVADLIITDPATQTDVLQKRLPYRSVEIFNPDDPAINSLALLDHEAPFLELPMLMVGEVEDASTDGASATFSLEGVSSTPPVLAYFRRGKAVSLLMQGDDMTTKTTKPDEKKATKPDEKKATPPEEPKGQNFADDGGDDGDDKDKDDGEKMEGDDLNIDAVVKAIESGEISVDAMDKILAAIQAQRTKSEQDPDAADSPAPAMAPGGEAMSKNEKNSEHFALRGEIEALKAKDRERDAADQRKVDVDSALKRLEGRPLGADLKDRLVAFHKEHGASAFKAYVDSMVSTFATFEGDDGDKALTFAGQTGKAPEVAMKYQDKGSDAVARAAKFCDEYRDLKERGLVRMSEERYVAINMERIGA